MTWVLVARFFPDSDLRADYVRQRTGYAIGGVPPVGHVEYTLQVLPPAARPPAMRRMAEWVASGGVLLVITRGREPDEPEGNMPWPLAGGVGRVRGGRAGGRAVRGLPGRRESARAPLPGFLPARAGRTRHTSPRRHVAYSEFNVSPAAAAGELIGLCFPRIFLRACVRRCLVAIGSRLGLIHREYDDADRD